MSPAIPDDVRARVRAQAGDRCGYCRSPQRYVLGVLEIEHIIPTARGGSDDEENLWLACRLCNGYKGTQTHGRDPVTGQWVRLFNPLQQLPVEWHRPVTGRCGRRPPDAPTATRGAGVATAANRCTIRGGSRATSGQG